MKNKLKIGSRVTQRRGTKTRAVWYGGRKGMAIKQAAAKHSDLCTCKRCRKWAERRKQFPLMGTS